MSVVVLVNPNLPGRHITQPEHAVKVLARSGWVPATEEELAEIEARKAELDQLRVHPGYGEIGDAVEHPADGTLSPPVGNDEPGDPTEPPAEPGNTDEADTAAESDEKE